MIITSIRRALPCRLDLNHPTHCPWVGFRIFHTASNEVNMHEHMTGAPIWYPAFTMNFSACYIAGLLRRVIAATFSIGRFD
jgi:hypothetical protein